MHQMFVRIILVIINKKFLPLVYQYLVIYPLLIKLQSEFVAEWTRRAVECRLNAIDASNSTRTQSDRHEF